MSPFHSSSRGLRRPFAVVFAIMVIAANRIQAETWTDLRGTRSVEAKMLGLFEGNVVLLMDDGRRVTVPMTSLRSDSRIQAEKLSLELQKKQSELVKELKTQAAEAAAPAPSPIPKPASPPAYKKPVKGAKVVDALKHVDDQLAAGHLVAAFDALPPSYRKDLDDIVKLAVSKINPGEWQSLVGTVHQVGDLVVTRQRWFFSHPRIVAMPLDSLEPTKELLLLISGMLRDGFDPDAMTLEKLQSMPFGDWLAARDQAMAPYLHEMNQLYGGSGFRDYEVVTTASSTTSTTSTSTSSGGEEDAGSGEPAAGVTEETDKVTVRVTGSGSTSESEFQRVEGFWVPKDWADGWTDWVATTKTRLEETPDGMLLSANPMTMLPATLEPILNPLMVAQDERQFHTAMESLFGQAQTIATMAGVTLDLPDKSDSSSGGF